MKAFDGIKTLDDATEITDVTSFDETLAEPFEDMLDFDAENDPEVDMNARLDGAKTFRQFATRRLFADYRPDPEAMRHLEQLPAEGESLHAVMSQKYSMWDLVPAIIALTDQPIDDLHVATLSYNAKTAADLLGLLDDGRIKRVSLIVSAYFKAQNRGLYDSLVPPLRERGHRVLAMRNHAKLLLIASDAGRFVCEGSANLRSCKNVEQFVLTRSRELYAFHRDWMEADLLSRCEETS